MVYVLAGGKGFSGVLNINLAKLIAGSQLVKGFSHELSSWPLIQLAIRRQQAQIASGQANDTGLSADNYLPLPPSGNGFGGLDQDTYQTAVHPPDSYLSGRVSTQGSGGEVPVLPHNNNYAP
jgi:hypothetical protein